MQGRKIQVELGELPELQKQHFEFKKAKEARIHRVECKWGGGFQYRECSWDVEVSLNSSTQCWLTHLCEEITQNYGAPAERKGCKIAEGCKWLEMVPIHTIWVEKLHNT